MVRIEEGLYFANIEQIKDMFKRIEIFGSHNAHPTASMKSAGSLENIIGAPRLFGYCLYDGH